MAKKYNIKVFGKAGCDKCRVLNQRLDGLLQKDEWADFDKTYVDLDTVDGLVEFCKAECINPQRVPAFVVCRQNENGKEQLLARSRPEQASIAGNVALHHLVGLQTDYSQEGRGVLRPDMIAAVLEEAREQ